MGIDFDDEAAAAKRRSETRAARKIVQVSLAVLIAGTMAAAMRAHGHGAETIGRLAATEIVALGAMGFFAVRTPHPTVRLVSIVFLVVLTALSVGVALLVAAVT